MKILKTKVTIQAPKKEVINAAAADTRIPYGFKIEELNKESSIFIDDFPYPAKSDFAGIEEKARTAFKKAGWNVLSVEFIDEKQSISEATANARKFC